MAKKKKKKSRKSQQQPKHPAQKSVQTAAKKTHPAAETAKTPSIQLTAKIHLEGHHHGGHGGRGGHGGVHEPAASAFHISPLLRRFLRIAMFCVQFIGVVLGLGALSLGILFVVYGRDLPDVHKLKDMNLAETSVLYDREGNMLYSIYSEENRKYVPLNYVSPYVVYATLSIEDKHFFQHMGFDIFGILRAQLKNLEDDKISQGASTITQQLAKNVFLSPERTYDRKIKELLLSLQIEWAFSKEDILEMYLNKIPYGSNAFGIEAAAKTYFGKTSKDLTLAESAIVAALPKAPSYYSPYGQNRKELMGYCNTEVVTSPLDDPKPLGDQMPEDILEEPLAVTAETTQETLESSEDVAAVPSVQCLGPYDPHYVPGRKDAALERMLEDGYITYDQLMAAWQESLTLTFRDPVHTIEAPHFVFYVKEYLEKKYGKEMVENGGLEVITTLDPQLQSLAEESVAMQADINLQRYSANNSALVALDPKLGQILAMVGSKNYWDESIDGQVNVATSVRQPGSSFKPLVYAAAVQNGGIGSGTILADHKTVFAGNYVPSNSDDTYKGPMSVRTALATSRNIPAIKAFYIAGGEEKVLDFVDSLGVTSLKAFKNSFNATAQERGWTFHYGPAMAIGSGEVSLLELTAGYGVLANGGLQMPVTPVLEVRDKNGNVLEKYEAKGKQVMDPQSAFVVNNVLADVAARPAGSWRAAITIPDRTIAVKTGTSNKKVHNTDYPNNLLTVGYTPDLAVGVWTGNTDGRQVRMSAWGLFTSAPIWKHFMENALKDQPDAPFPQPEGLVWKGKEVFPSFQKSVDDEKMFERADTQETVEVPLSDFILGGEMGTSTSGDAGTSGGAGNSNGNSTGGTSDGNSDGGESPKPPAIPLPPRTIEPSTPIEKPAQGNRGDADYGF